MAEDLPSPSRPQAGTAGYGIAERLAALDWEHARTSLGSNGHAILPRLLTEEECGATAALFDQSELFRSHIHMARHGFGSGEYKYFADPVPPLVQSLREGAYPHLAPIANAWNGALGREQRFPGSLGELRQRCAEAGQVRPTPLLLRYGPGDFNCLHQDVYGELVFPIQVAVLLSRPGEGFEGGEFVLVEQRPRMQSRAEVVPLRQGDAVAFAVRERPMQGTRGTYRVAMRHGVSRVRAGQRFTLGIIFHDAT
jgi:uncharacterized protein